jgi:hypothetical protein
MEMQKTKKINFKPPLPSALTVALDKAAECNGQYTRQRKSKKN